MKSAPYRHSLLLSCAALAVCVAQPAFSFAGIETPPSIEIHLDVLNQLVTPASPPTKGPVSASDPAPEAPVFGKPTPAPKHAPAAATPHPAHKVASNTKTPAHKKPAQVAAKHTPKETVVADRESIPRPDVKVMTDTAPAAAASHPVADVPKLPEAEVKAAAPAAPKPDAAADVSGGLADVLGDDAGKKPSAGAAAIASVPLANPPADLTAAAPAGAPSDKAPPALAAVPAQAPLQTADAPPSLAPVPKAHTDTTAGKMVTASNDLPPMPAQPPLVIEPAKPDLPPLSPAADKAPPASQEMAQATLTPLPGLPATPPSAATAPTPPALPAAPPAAPAPAASLPPAAPATPDLPPAAPAEASATTPAGATPDVRLIFNESETDIPLGSTGKLDALAAALNSNPAARITIMAYASGPETTGIYPKRVSLARGIAVRNYLTSTKGVDIERVNVKALGNKDTGGGPGDRVDLFVLK